MYEVTVVHGTREGKIVGVEVGDYSYGHFGRIGIHARRDVHIAAGG